jgi:hypothetical protein
MRVESVGFARDEAQRARLAASDVRATTALEPPATASRSDTGTYDSDGKVLDLDEWRRNRDQRH